MKVRIGIIGPGRIAERFASVARTSESVELVAAASRDQSRARAFAASFGLPKAYGSYADLARDPEVDAVYIALTHNFHYGAARLCLEAGKAVLCEKPLVTTRREAESLAATAKSHNALLMEAMWSRCVPATIRAREWARSGRIGRIRLIDASFCFKAAYDPEDRLFNPALAGGALYDAGVYPIEFATGMAGEEPSAVEGVAALGETGVDVFDSVSLGFPGGAVASLKCGLTARVPQDAFVYGGLGSIAVYGFLGPRKAELFDAQGKSVEVFEEGFDDGFIYEIEHFAELYRAGKKESDLIPLRDSIACAGVFDTLMGKWGLM
jgi:predicted dehydrogenase